MMKGMSKPRSRTSVSARSASKAGQREIGDDEVEVRGEVREIVEPLSDPPAGRVEPRFPQPVDNQVGVGGAVLDEQHAK